jgi:NCS1 family nucleobase:cation symporter-1
VLAATNFIQNYESFLFFLGYWTAPWAAIVFMGHHFHRASRLPGVSAGFAAWIIGIGASVPFFNQYPLFVGSFANAYPQCGDISFAVGAVVAIIAYFALTTSAPAYAAAE